MRNNTQVLQPSGFTEHVADEAVYKELDDKLVRATTTASSLEAEHDSEPTNVDHQLAERLQAQEQEELTDAEKATLFQQLLEKRRKHFAAKRAEEKRNKPPTQAQKKKIMRVKKLEKKQRSRTHKLKRLYKVGLIARVDFSEDDQSLGDDASKQGRKIHDIDANEDITLVNDQDDAEMFDVNNLQGEEVFVEKEVADKEINDEV
nr:hypothetical protein [Tanacetum cinerariifolium]